MLVAELNGCRIDAFSAERGPSYVCPGCRGEVTLKKGRKVVHHFAHKPPTKCTWAKGETRAHMEAKATLANALVSRGLKAELEYTVNTLTGDRRADVMAWSPQGRQVAFELQHTPISLDDIERRASSYASADIAQIWIPFIRHKVWDEGGPSDGNWLFQRYTPHPFERWVYGFNGETGMWMFDDRDNSFWLGQLADHQSYVEETSWFDEYGDENYAGGYWRTSKRYMELTLKGPFNIGDLRISVTKRRSRSSSGHHWPAALVADLTPA